MCSTTSWFLPRSARSSASCSAMPAARAPRIDLTPAVIERTSAIAAAPTMSRLAGTRLPDSAASSRGSRLLASSASSPLTFASSAFCADTGNTWSTGTASVSALARTWRAISNSTSAGERMSSHRPSILLRITRRPERVVGSAPARWSFQTSRSVLVTPESAARMNSTACAEGSSESVSSGSVPIALRPGVSRMTSPCFRSGCGKLTTAWRQHGMSTLPSSRCSNEAMRSSSWSPYRRASATGTRLTCDTRPSASLMRSAEARSSGSVTHSSA